MATTTDSGVTGSNGLVVMIDSDHDLIGEDNEERRKILTMKYGAHQMKLIRKRLSVEFWMDDQLKNLYQVQDTHAYDCEIDLDRLLDLDDDEKKRNFLREKLTTLPKTKDSELKITAFINEILEKAATL